VNSEPSTTATPASDAAIERRRLHGLRLTGLHLRVSVMNELQYRANFVIQLIQSMVALGTGLVVLTLVFDRTDTLDGWTQPQLLVVMGVFTMVGGIIGFVIEPNMGRVMADIRDGGFDHVLTKPVDAQLLSSVREFRVWRLTDVVLGLIVLVWGITGLDTAVGVVDVVAFVGSLAVGSILVYCLWLVVTSGSFWFVRMDQVQEMFFGLYRAGQYPVTVYPAWLRLLLTYLVPIGFAVTVPSESLTGRLTWERGVITVVFLVVAFVLTRFVWVRGSRRYSGASA
jgi:ABC-2 type transport system permease protein